jgi:hypothetical protein
MCHQYSTGRLFFPWKKQLSLHLKLCSKQRVQADNNTIDKVSNNYYILKSRSTKAIVSLINKSINKKHCA